MSRIAWKRTALSLLALLVLVIVVGFYLVLDQGVTITYMQVGYRDTKSDLELLTRVVPELHRGSSKPDVLAILRELEPDALIVERGDTLGVQGLEFQFDSSGNLVSVERP